MTNSLKCLLIALICGASLLVMQVRGADSVVPDRLEYLTLRWGGRDNTHLIRPNGEVEFIGKQLMAWKRPERADDRSFYMNIAMNALAKDGWELTAMTSDDYVFKRRVK